MSPKSLKDIVLAQIKNLDLRFPIAEVSAKTGYSDGTVSEYLSGKKPISDKFFRKFCEVFELNYDDYKGAGNQAKQTIFVDPLDLPQSVEEKQDGTPPYQQGTFEDDADFTKLNPDLLAKPSTPKETIILGKNPNQRLRAEDFASAFPDWKGLPIYNSPITASFIATYRDENIMQPYYYLHDPRFKDCDFGAIITGDSMYPEIRHGDIVICKEVQDKSFIVYGDIYYVTARNGLETCKYVNGHDTDENKLMLVPRNDSIKPSPIHKDMLLKLYKLRGLVRGY